MAGFNEKKELTITYETLYELLRREKGREDIQELDADFILSVKQYLEDKRSMLHKDAGQQMLFSEEEQKKTLQQISNIIKLVRELYDRREKKIISLAINMSKTNSNAIKSDNLLHEEKVMFESIVDILNFNRANILCAMLDENKGKEVLSRLNGTPAPPLPRPKASAPAASPADDSGSTSSEQRKDEKESSQNPAIEATGQSPDANIIKVKFREAVAKFIDPKLKVHGPFEAGQTADLPSVVADVLLKKGKAETI